MLRIVITGATALATLLMPTDASASAVRPFSSAAALSATARVTFAGVVVTPGSGSLVVSVRSGRRDGSPRSVTVVAAPGASVRLDGRTAPLSRIPASARISVTGTTTPSGTIQAMDITATR